MASISLNLALLNLMPVPVLDGGQMTILMMEGLFRRDLSMKWKEGFAIAGATDDRDADGDGALQRHCEGA